MGVIFFGKITNIKNIKRLKGLLQIDDFQSLICSALFLLNKKIETIFVISKNFTILFIFL